jgi:hypothetical protein
MILTVRPATEADARFIGKHLRINDAREVMTVTGQSGEPAVLTALHMSRECYSIRLSKDGVINENPCVIFGLTDSNTVWMMTTPMIIRAPLSILRECRLWLDHWVRRDGVVQNVVDLRNHLHVRWIQLLGCTMGDIYDVKGLPFQHFYKERISNV